MITRSTRIKDLGEIITGNTPPRNRTDYYGNYIPFVKATDIDVNSKFTYSPEEYYSEIAFKKYKKSLIPKGSTCVVTIGTVGKKMTMAHTDMFINQAMNAIVPYKKFDNEYIYYLLKYNLFQLKGIDSGTTSGRENISKSAFSNIQVSVIDDISTQRRIGMILAKYDELIEMNNQRIKKLEQTAEELYKEWFVRFRFPNYQNTEFEKSSLGRIPSSFKILKMSDVISCYIGGGWGADVEDSSYPQKAYVIRGTDFPKVEKGDISSVPCRFHKESNYKARSLKENDIVIEISGGTAEQPVGRAILISKRILNRLDNQLICASFCKQLRLNTNIISPIYYLYWIKFLYDTRMIERYQLQSTGIINFKFEYFLKKGDVLLPPDEIMNAFSQKVSALREQIDILATQNENLIKQRDLLLPRLMSGKLEV